MKLAAGKTILLVFAALAAALGTWLGVLFTGARCQPAGRRLAAGL